jgi:predicted polyphosphate/ATP-dependent NAD kinase
MAGGSGYAAAAEGGISIVSGLQQAGLVREQARLTSMLSQMNEQYADLEAFDTEGYTEAVAARTETQGQQTVGSQRVAMAAENVDVNFGTAKEIQNESKLNTFLNVIDIRQQGRARALGIKREARNATIQSMINGGAAGLQASATQTAGFLNAAATGANYYMRTK